MCLQCRMLWRQVNRLVPEIEGFLTNKNSPMKVSGRNFMKSIYISNFYIFLWIWKNKKPLKLSKFLCQNLGKIMLIYFVMLFESFETFWSDFRLRVLGTNIWNSQTCGSKKVFEVSSKLCFVAHPSINQNKTPLINTNYYKQTNSIKQNLCKVLLMCFGSSANGGFGFRLDPLMMKGIVT